MGKLIEDEKNVIDKEEMSKWTGRIMAGSCGGCKDGKRKENWKGIKKSKI